jgi:hypothetical protein
MPVPVVPHVTATARPTGAATATAPSAPEVSGGALYWSTQRWIASMTVIGCDIVDGDDLDVGVALVCGANKVLCAGIERELGELVVAAARSRAQLRA